MIVNITDEQSSLKINLQKLEQIVKQVILNEGWTCDEVNLYLIDTPTMCTLHEDYFNDNTPTDCISFPMDDEEDDSSYKILGEVFVCPETAIDYAAKHQKDPIEETILYVIHGLLHLMGYDDIDEADRKEMRKAEKRHMDLLKK